MPEYRTEPLLSPSPSGLLPEGERNRRVALTSFGVRTNRSQVPGREVECYECGRRSHVPAAALSASCVHCHAHLRMADVELKPGSQRLTVRTLGNVTILPEAKLSHLSIVCGNLYIYGQASGSFRCTGVLQISKSTRIEGPVTAGRVLIEKGADVIFVQGVRAGSMEIQGRATGRVDAAGTVLLRKGSLLCGDCRSPRLVTENGSSHHGQWVRTAAT